MGVGIGRIVYVKMFLCEANSCGLKRLFIWVLRSWGCKGS